MANSAEDEKRINTIRFLAVDAVQKANSGHPGMPLGAAAAAYTLWSRHMQFDPADPKWFNRDRFVLSAGHASALLYALLHLFGYDLTIDDLKSFRQLGSRTPGHPEYHHTAGVEVTTGPLGQGFANAVGLAMAQEQLAATYSNGGSLFDHFTYVMAGDGDMMEGVASEAASLAGHLKLGKLICLYDDNKISLAAPTSVTFTEDVGKRFEGYGWHVAHIDEAHANDVATIDAAIKKAQSESDRPSIILIHSIIGFASPRAGTFAAHGEPLGADNVTKTKEALGWPLEPAFLVPDDVRTYFNGRKAAGAKAHAAWDAVYTDWKRANADLAKQFERARDGKLPADLPWPTFNEENGSLASRDAGGTVMNAIAKALPELVGGSADLDPSTKTYLKGFGEFQPGTYGGRNMHFGVREFAMAAAANGMAAHGGLLPFCATFFNFLDYCKAALRLAALNKNRVVYVFTHDSVFLGEDGPTHQPVEQLSALRATPNVIDIRPADALETLEAWKIAVQPDTGPTVIVLSRQKLPYLGDRNAAVSRGAYVLDEPAGTPDVILIATGSEVQLARAAAKLLAVKGTKARVVSMPSWHLFEQQDAAYRESVLPAAIKARVSIEAAATIGWHKYVGDRGLAYGIDHFGTSAPAAAIEKEYGFTPEHIADVATGLLAGV
ncbi:MAG TPA: transketolase [Candidatus Lustribacter sp.]|jgi:transketolase|nr:transketolase [Candidatus Lustribacter sp.]